MFLRWLSTKIAQTVPLHWTRWPPELKIEKPLNEFSSLTSASILKNFTGRFLGWPSTKIAQTVPLCWTRWPPELKIEKPLNDFFSWTRGWILKSLYRNVSWVTLYQNCSNDSATLNKMAARAINRNKLLMTSSAKSVDRFWNNFTGMFLRWLSTKIAQTVSLRWTRWPP